MVYGSLWMFLRYIYNNLVSARYKRGAKMNDTWSLSQICFVLCRQNNSNCLFNIPGSVHRVRLGKQCYELGRVYETIGGKVMSTLNKENVVLIKSSEWSRQYMRWWINKIPLCMTSLSGWCKHYRVFTHLEDCFVNEKSSIKRIILMIIILLYNFRLAWIS